MKMIIDDKSRTLTVQEDRGGEKILNLFSPEAFELMSKEWLRIGWDQKYVYTFSWMGRPIIQLPEDMIRIQEVIYRIKPDVIIETGIAHGGSLVYNASLCQIIGKGRVIGVDIEIRPRNRKAIEEHPLKPLITLIEGSSIDEKIVENVADLVGEGEIVLVILDSNHLKDHVLDELRCYSKLVTKGSYIVATDGIMQDVYNVPRGTEGWKWNNPTEAAKEFVKENNSFILEDPTWPFNESPLKKNVTHWPGAYLKRVK